MTPVVLSASPTGTVASVGSMTVTFSDSIVPASFDAPDVTLTGPNGTVPVSSITQVSLYSFTISFAVITVSGTYDYSIGPNISDIYGNAMAAAYQGSFVVDATPPTLLPGKSTEQGPLSQRQEHFSEPIDFSRSLSSGLVVMISGPQGTFPISIVSGSGADYTLTFPTLTVPGVYTISANNKIWDLVGNQIAAPPQDVFTLVNAETWINPSGGDWKVAAVIAARKPVESHCT